MRQDVLLGGYGSRERRERYARVIAEWEQTGRSIPCESRNAAYTVNEVLLRYYQHAEGYYLKNGQPSSQLERVRRSLSFVKNLYGQTEACRFGSLALKAVRQKMIEAGWV